MNACHPLFGSTALSVALHAALLSVLVVSADAMLSQHGHIEIELVGAAAPASARARAVENAMMEQAAAEVDPSPVMPVSRAQSTAVRTQATPLQAEAGSRGIEAASAISEPGPAGSPAPSAQVATAAARAGSKAGSQDDAQADATARRDGVEWLARLLHREISARMQYPYLARKRGVDGVSRVSFMLHPNGRVADARIVSTSRSRLLDSAAMTAVNSIAPFMPAADYLDRPEHFEIDVVFNLH